MNNVRLLVLVNSVGARAIGQPRAVPREAAPEGGAGRRPERVAEVQRAQGGATPAQHVAERRGGLEAQGGRRATSRIFTFAKFAGI